jgi:hypothetical protein
MTITEVLRLYGIPVAPPDHHHRTRGREQTDCPWCDAPGHFRLGIRPDGQCACWTCGGHGLAATLSRLTGRPPKEFVELLGGLALPKYEPRPRGRYKPPPGVGPLTGAHLRYLKSRRFDPDEITGVWGVGGIGFQPHVRWRLFIPVHRRGQPVSWTTRSVSPCARVRYVSAKPEEESFPHKEWLYGLDKAGNSVVVVEGPTDVWRVGPGAVATLGASVTRAQVRLIANVPVRTVCFDNEPEAQRRAKKLCDELSLFPGVTRRVEIDAEDAGSAGPREVAALRRILR